MNSKIRVLHVIGKRPKGGIGTFLQNITKYIDKDKFQFDFLINANLIPGIFDTTVTNLGSRVEILPELSYKSVFCYLKALKRFYKSEKKYDIVHIHSPNIAIFNYIFARKFSSAKIAIHSHSTKFSDKPINSIRNFLLHLPIRIISDIKFACNKASSIFLYGKNATDKGEVNIVKNGIEIQRYAFNRKKRDAMRLELNITDEILIGHVGAFLPVKNHDFLLAIFLEVLKIEPKAVLVLVGDGELLDNIVQKVNKLCLTDSVKFLGRRTDIDKIMQALDIFVLPSKFEGMPLVGIEAQSSGLPCFFSDRISEEIKITSTVSFIEIEASPYYWAVNIIENIKKNNYIIESRIEAYQLVANKKYDIIETVKELEEAYSNNLK